MKVLPIKKEETHEWLLYKHYAKRIPPISLAYGLYGNDLIGVCTFGPPCRVFNNGEYIFHNYKIRTFELNRLCVERGLPKNTLSKFLTTILKQLERPLCIVSYADDTQGHHGYIYQATNFIYTGCNEVHDTEYIIDGKKTHCRTLASQGITAPKEWAKLNDIEMAGKSRKHRYFMFLGSKKQKREMIKKLRFPILPYPKGDNKKYDDSYNPQVQGLLI